MNEIIMIMADNVVKIGLGATLFLAAYVANIALGAWKSVKIEGMVFDWKLIGQSLVKYLVLAVGIGLLSISITGIPIYVQYVGLTIPEEYMDVVSNIVIIGSFVVGTCVYIKDGVEKVKDIFVKK